MGKWAELTSLGENIRQVAVHLQKATAIQDLSSEVFNREVKNLQVKVQGLMKQFEKTAKELEIAIDENVVVRDEDVYDDGDDYYYL